MYAEEVVDVAVLLEEVEGVEEAESKDEVTVPIRYLCHTVMELLFLN